MPDTTENGNGNPRLDFAKIVTEVLLVCSVFYAVLSLMGDSDE